MDKVIVERPRLGHRDKRRRPGRDRPLEDEDGTPLRARAPRKDRLPKTKALNENLSPLYRYLDAQVNRPWDKVWSEISENLRPTSTVQQHVRDHVPDRVAIRTRLEGGKVMVAREWGPPVPLKQCWQPLYVDPRTGVLRRNPHWNARRRTARKAKQAENKARAARMREVNPRTQLHRLNDGAWWEVRLAKAPGESRDVGARFARLGGFARPENDLLDVVLRASLSDLSRYELYGRSGVIAADKRQLSRREAKRRGLV